MAVMRPLQVTLTGAAEPERVDGQYVSADYFRVLGVPTGARTRLSGVRRSALTRPFAPSPSSATGYGGAVLAETPAIVGRQTTDAGHPRNRHRRPAPRVRECPESLGGNLVDPAIRHFPSPQWPRMGPSPAYGGPAATGDFLWIRQSRSSTRSPRRSSRSSQGRPGHASRTASSPKRCRPTSRRTVRPALLRRSWARSFCFSRSRV